MNEQNNTKGNGQTKGSTKKGGRFNNKSRHKGGSNGPRSTRTEGGSKYITGSDPTVKDMDACRTNDISWWNKATDLYQDATRTPHEYVRGTQYPTQFAGVDSNFMGDSRMLPSIMRIDYVNGPGWAQSPTDPINRMFTNMLSDLLSKTASSTLDFQQCDLAITFMMGTDIAANIAAAKRALGFSYTYPVMNRLLPNVLLKAMGFNPGSIMGRQDNCRVMLNDIIRDFNALSIPNFIDLVDREYSLNHNVWAVDSSVTSELYLFRKHGYYRFIAAGDDATTETCQFNSFKWKHGTAVEDVDLYDFFDYLQIIRQQLDDLRYSSFLPLVTAGLRRAYKDNQKFMYIEPVGVDQIQTPSVSEEILNQIANCSIIDVNKQTLNITSDRVTGVLHWKPQFDTSYEDSDPLNFQKAAERTIFYKQLNLYDADLDDKYVMEGTRLMNFVDDNGRDNNHNALTYCGCDIVTRVSVIELVDPSQQTVAVYSLNSNFIPDVDGFELADVVKFTNFTIYPTLTLGAGVNHYLAGETRVTRIAGTYGSCARFAPIDRTQFKLLQDAAFTSLYLYERISL